MTPTFPPVAPVAPAQLGQALAKATRATRRYAPMPITGSLLTHLQIADIQAQIDSTVDIMHDNITKVAERGERLDALQDKTGRLPSYSWQFLS